MYYKNHAAAPGSDLPGQKIVLQLGAIIVLLVFLAGMVPTARAEDVTGAAGSGAMPRTASAETPSESPAPTATPSPDEELGDQLKDGFSDSVLNIVGEIGDFINEDIGALAGGNFRLFLAGAFSTVMTTDLWTLVGFMFLVVFILAVYRMLKE